MSYTHRLNMEVDLQSLLTLHVTWLAQQYSPPHLDSYTRALLVSKDGPTSLCNPLVTLLAIELTICKWQNTVNRMRLSKANRWPCTGAIFDSFFVHLTTGANLQVLGLRKRGRRKYVCIEGKLMFINNIGTVSQDFQPYFIVDII